MKNHTVTKFLYRLTSFLLIFFAGQLTFGQVKIGDNAENVSPYAILELESSNLGFIWPRLTNEQRNAAFTENIPIGLTIFNTDEQCIQYWDSQQWQCAGEGGENSNASGTILTGSGGPSNSETATNIINVRAGTLYIDYSNGELYVAVDNGASGGVSGDGISDEWVTLKSGTDGTEGPVGPRGPAGPAGEKGLDGQGIIIGTTSPPTATVTSSTLYIDSVTGQQYINNGGSTWQLLPSSGIDNGTLVGATLRWDGNAWVENTALSAGATDTTVNVNNDISLNAENNISLNATNTTISSGNNINLSATETLTLSSGKAIALTTTSSLQGVLLDNSGSAGVNGQVLTSTGTKTLWVTRDSGLINGTQDFSTLHWNGSAWVENTALSAGATDTTVNVNNDISLNAENNISLNATNTMINAENTISLISTNTTISSGNNINLSATETLTLSGGKAIALTTTTSIDKALLDSEGNPGLNGQVLASTSTQTTWITLRGNTVTQTTSNYAASVDDGTIVAMPASAITITLPTIEDTDTGKTLTIKRGNVYSIDSNSGAPLNPLELSANGGATIDGATSLKLNLSYQGYTLQAFAGNWIIIQRF
jgi:hypothetical protein